MSKSPEAQTSGKNLLHLLAAGAALTLLAGGSGVYLVSKHISALDRIAAAKTSDVGTNQQIAQRFQQTQTDYEATLARTKYLETSVSAKAYVPTLLQQLQILATATHLTVAAVRPGPITVPGSAGAGGGAAASPPSGDSSGTTVKRTPRPPYDTMDIGVDVTGSYASTSAFLYGLTRFPKIVAVTAVQMRPAASSGMVTGTTAPGAPTGVMTSLHLTAFVFHQATGAAAPTGEAAATPYHPFSMLRLPQASGESIVSDAAGHAATRALGATRAANDRAQVGISTL